MSGILAQAPPGAMQLVVFVLVSLSMGGLVMAFAPGGPRRGRLERRVETIARQGAARRPGKAVVSEAGRRRRVVEDALRELEEEQAAKARKRTRPTLHGRLRQAGLEWSRKTYAVISVVTGLACWAVVLAGLRLGPLPALAFGLAGGLLLPHLYVSRKRSRRLLRFAQEFPNALDVVVRGIKAGLPLGDCLRIIAAEAQEPVRAEFQALVHDQTVGVPLDEAVERLADRVPLPETNFFGIVLAIQARAGGNLSEALGNLSRVLRERKNLKEKIKAMSAEAKASGGIIAAMPVLVTVLLFFFSPDYIGLLFSTTPGNVTLAACGVWMLTGTMVMRKMIHFDF